MAEFLIGNCIYTADLFDAETADMLVTVRDFLDAYAEKHGATLAEQSRQEGSDNKASFVIAVGSEESRAWQHLADVLRLFVSDFEAKRMMHHKVGSGLRDEKVREAFNEALMQRSRFGAGVPLGGMCRDTEGEQ